MRMRKKPNLSARMEACADLLITQPCDLRGHWRDLKADAQELWLELGCGKGRFTVQTAQQHPEVLYIAVERVPDAMVTAMERCRELKLSNVFFIDGDAVSTWAQEPMQWAIANGLINGKGNQTLDPRGIATRAEVATMIQKFCSNIAN